tara:strand:- start:145 stop:585 length:441 start_codon:yes stop_codon:yes gene_type:complete
MSLDYQPTIHWDEQNLHDAAEFLCVANPQGNPDIDSKIKYIKNYATTSLMEAGKPIDIATGGWQVCFYLNTNDSGYPIDFEYYAKVSITPYTASYYMKQQEGYKDIVTGLEVKHGQFVYPKDERIHCYEDSSEIDCSILQDIGLTD